jgi:hypothetical protein
MLTVHIRVLFLRCVFIYYIIRNGCVVLLGCHSFTLVRGSLETWPQLFLFPSEQNLDQLALNLDSWLRWLLKWSMSGPCLRGNFGIRIIRPITRHPNTYQTFGVLRQNLYPVFNVQAIKKNRLVKNVGAIFFLQWPSEYRTSLVFRLAFCALKWNGPVIECHLKTGYCLLP